MCAEPPHVHQLEAVRIVLFPQELPVEVVQYSQEGRGRQIHQSIGGADAFSQKRARGGSLSSRPSGCLRMRRTPGRPKTFRNPSSIFWWEKENDLPKAPGSRLTLPRRSIKPCRMEEPKTCPPPPGTGSAISRAHPGNPRPGKSRHRCTAGSAGGRYPSWNGRCSRCPDARRA